MNLRAPVAVLGWSRRAGQTRRPDRCVVRITIVRRASGVEEDRLPGRRPLAGGDAGWLDRSIGVEQQGAGRTGAAARAVSDRACRVVSRNGHVQLFTAMQIRRAAESFAIPVFAHLPSSWVVQE